jgi:DNA-binding transcriptional MerR regulator
LLPETERTAGGYREYTFEDVRDVMRIRKLVDLGFSLEEIKDILRGPRGGHLADETIKRKAQELTEQLAKLQRRADALDEVAGTGELFIPVEFADRLERLREVNGLTDEDLNPLIQIVELTVASGQEAEIQVLRERLDAMGQGQLDQYDVQLDRALRQIGPETSDQEVEWLAHEMAQRAEAFARRAGFEHEVRQRRDRTVGGLIESSLWGMFNDRQLAVLDKALSELAVNDNAT